MVLHPQVERWNHRHLPDPRLLMDGDNFLPCQIAARRGRESIARMLLPSNPITSLFDDNDLNLLGPPTLAAIAGAVLRGTLANDLGALMQEQEDPVSTSTGDAGSSVDAATAALAAPSEQLADGEGTEEESLSAASAAALVVEEASTETTDDVPKSLAANSIASMSSAGDRVCDVCFDAATQVRLAPCSHELCLSCCKSLLDMNSRCVMVCPFCRGGVRHLMPVCQPVERSVAMVAAATPFPPEPAVALSSNQLVL